MSGFLFLNMVKFFILFLYVHDNVKVLDPKIFSHLWTFNAYNELLTFLFNIFLEFRLFIENHTNVAKANDD